MRLLFSLIFLAGVLSASAQTTTQPANKEDAKKPLTIGEHFIKANQYHTGALVFGTITAAEMLFAINPGTAVNQKRATLIMVLAGVTGSGAVGFGIASWYHVGEAGKLMNAQVDVGLQEHGVGIALKF